MAFPVSSFMVAPFLAMHDGTDAFQDWVNDTLKYALFTNSITIDLSGAAVFGSAPFDANEADDAGGTSGYTAGGVSLSGKTWTEDPTGFAKFDTNDPSWSGATFGPVRGGAIWNDTVGDRVIAVVNFGAEYGVTSGIFTVQLASTGIHRIQLIPS